MRKNYHLNKHIVNDYTISALTIYFLKAKERWRWIVDVWCVLMNSAASVPLTNCRRFFVGFRPAWFSLSFYFYQYSDTFVTAAFHWLSKRNLRIANSAECCEDAFRIILFPKECISQPFAAINTSISRLLKYVAWNEKLTCVPCHMINN